MISRTRSKILILSKRRKRKRRRKTINRIKTHISAQYTGHKGAIYALLDLPQDDAFISGGGEGWIVKWDRTGNSPDGLLIAKVDAPVFCMIYDASTELIIVGCMNGDVVWLDLKERNLIKKINLSSHSIFDLIIDDDQLISVNSEGYLTTWDLLRMAPKISHPISSHSLRSILKINENQFLLGASDGAIHHWDNSDHKIIDKISDAHLPSVFSIVNNNNYIISAGRDAKVKKWDLATKEPVSTIDAHLFTVNKLMVLPTLPNILVSASRDKSIRFWDLTSDKLIHSIKAGRPSHINSVNSLLFLEGESSIISASDDQSLIRHKITQLD